MIIPVKTLSDKYNIVIEKGSINNLNKYINTDRKSLVVTDSGVPEIYSKIVAEQCADPFIITVEQGEPTKCFETYKYLLSKMTDYNFTRSDCVIAVGGGVVGDLSGFAASTYMRGIDFYNIPTTVLSQVDSSVGGKVAIDFEGYKNIVGSFYQPKAVIIDSETLKTLPDRQISNGLAESVKMSLTFDEELFNIFEKADILKNMDLIIEKSIMIKKSVVEKDEKESGLRKVLNFGHTIAHAIESENNMCNYYHGECVALGMIPMCSLSVRNRLSTVLEKLNLPTKIKTNPEFIISAMQHDKKKSGDDITVIYVNDIGKYTMQTIRFEDFADTVREVLA